MYCGLTGFLYIQGGLMPNPSDLMMASNEELRSYDTSTGDSTYKTVGATFSEPIRVIKFKNDSDVDITISYDGTTDHDIILSGDREVEDLSSNKTSSRGFVRSAGEQIYAKSSSGTGFLYITTIYAE